MPLKDIFNTQHTKYYKYLSKPFVTCDIVKYYAIVSLILTLLYTSLDSKARNVPVFLCNIMCMIFICFLLNIMCMHLPNFVYYVTIILLICSCASLYSKVGCY
jgi:hypothetical protein